MRLLRIIMSPLIKLKNLISRSEFLKNVTFLMSGNLLAQVINFCSSPILTRLFTPENFGMLSLLLAISTIIGSISTLCYDRAIMLPKEDTKAFSVVILSFSILVLICFLSAIVIVLGRFKFDNYFVDEGFQAWLFIVPIIIFTQGMARILRYWAFRKKLFKKAAIARTTSALTNSGLKILTGVFIGAWTGGLVIGNVVSSLVALILLSSGNPKFKIKYLKTEVTYQQIKGQIIEYKNFPIYATWSSLLLHAARNTTVLVLSHFFSVAVVGYYALANQVLSQPINLLSDSFSNVFFQKVSKNVADGVGILDPFKKVVGGLFLIGIVPFSILAILGQIIFTMVFGHKWVIAGLYVQIMAPMLFLAFLNGPGNAIYEVLQKQAIKLKLNGLKAVISIGVMIFMCIYIGKPEAALVSFVGVNLIFEVLNLVVAYKLAKEYTNHLKMNYT